MLEGHLSVVDVGLGWTRGLFGKKGVCWVSQRGRQAVLLAQKLALDGTHRLRARVSIQAKNHFLRPASHLSTIVVTIV